MAKRGLVEVRSLADNRGWRVDHNGTRGCKGADIGVLLVNELEDFGLLVPGLSDSVSALFEVIRVCTVDVRL